MCVCVRAFVTRKAGITDFAAGPGNAQTGISESESPEIFIQKLQSAFLVVFLAR